MKREQISSKELKKTVFFIYNIDKATVVHLLLNYPHTSMSNNMHPILNNKYCAI